MAKTDTFFIRASITPDDDAGFVQTTIDLGAFVDALNKSVLRILNIEGEWAQGPDGAIPNGGPYMDGNTASFAAWQIATQPQTELMALSDKSCVAKGMLWARNPDTASNVPAQTYSDSHLPQHYTEGYLVAVEQLYLGAYGEADWAETSNLTFNVVLECQVESLTKEAAMALALSQQ
tara:strand:- start:1066 stop:1596 length:531 start_codon:yes stop_codon:yes gene_type:complete